MQSREFIFSLPGIGLFSCKQGLGLNYALGHLSQFCCCLSFNWHSGSCHNFVFLVSTRRFGICHNFVVLVMLMALMTLPNYVNKLTDLLECQEKDGHFCRY